MRQYLKQEVVDRIKENDKAIVRIATALDRRFRTVLAWLMANNNIILTTPTVLTILREELDLTDEQILEKEPVPAGS